MLARIRWRGKAHAVEKKGFHGPMDYRPFRSVRLGCATKIRLRPVPNIIPSKSMYKPRVSCTLFGGLRAYDGVERLKSLKCRVYAESTDLGISAIASSVEMKGQLESFAKHSLIQGIPSFERPTSFGRIFAYVRGLEIC